MKSVKIQVPDGYIIDKENSTFEEIKFKKIEIRPIFIDLGLPSKTLWADRNVGANDPTDYGKYYNFDEAIKLNAPTTEQIKELLKECNWFWIGNGCRVTGSNGNSIFLPAAGFRYDTNLFNVGSSGSYWSSSFGYSSRAYFVYFSSGGRSMSYYGNRRYGRSVRPVAKLTTNYDF